MGSSPANPFAITNVLCLSVYPVPDTTPAGLCFFFSDTPGAPIRLARAFQTEADDVERLLLHVAGHFKPPFLPDLESILQIRDVLGSNFRGFPAS